ncbi:hypothetical protein F5883DRAFT_686474 [Diaporthe sp. PMI_573]|nr:hypothetical protein F5883DRAFT_686474 [Diaporthaceae sp. PMI_573]
MATHFLRMGLGPWRYPPEFWDRLSTIPLIREALKELERRLRVQPIHPKPSPATSLPTTRRSTSNLVGTLIPKPTRDLNRFARHGGPDLNGLRGFSTPKTANHKAGLSESEVAESKISITAYHAAFDQHLTDHKVYGPRRSQRPDLNAIRSALLKPRPSLSLSQVSDGTFEDFQDASEEAKDEAEVMADVIPIISGTRKSNYPCARNTMFGHLKPLTDGTLAAAMPDIYYGTVPEQLDHPIRDDLGELIVPSTTLDKSVAPNFFLDAKGPNGSGAVMMRQARYDGAVGARGIHALQNYGVKASVYDGRPYTYSATYYGGTGTLQLYAHHLTAPASPEGEPEYHMTQIDSYALTGNANTFRQGVTAFRNARDLAAQHRHAFIQAANSRDTGKRR